MAKPDSSEFVPYWLEEKDWLCLIEFLPQDNEEERAYGAEVIGYLAGYAQMTDTRILALLGDPEADAYELLFSFSSEENKQRFLKLMQSNELTETDPGLISVPSADEIRDARPLGMVLSEDVIRHITAIGVLLVAGAKSERPN